VFVGKHFPGLSHHFFSPVSNPNSSADESAGTLYDPPDDTEAASVSDDDSVGLRLRLSEDDVDRLQAVAQQLGLTPSTIAQRAIQMVCNEVVTIQEDSRSPELLVDQYQARIDLLHAVDNGASAGPSLFTEPETENGTAAAAEHPPDGEKISNS
jgi:hypothetical protein